MHQFLVDFQTFSGPLVFYAMQGDSLSRKFQLVITDGGTPWTPPSGVAWFVYFGAPGMSSGFYDTITPASGSPYPAITVSENVATVEIAAQALEIAGINQLSVVVNDSTGYQIASWTIALHIKALPGYTASAATVYYNAISGQVAQVLANAQAAAASATLAQSWAVGGTGSREGENTNNSQYWAQQAQSIAEGQLGWYATEQALQAAHPTGQNGQWAIIGTTDTIWTWDSDTSAWVNSGSTADLSNYYTIPQANAAFATAAQGQLAATAMQPSVYDPSDLGVNATVQVYTHTRSGTVNNFVGTGAVGRALLTEDIQDGDTFTVNGQAVTAYMGTDNATESMAGSPYTGKWVTFVVEDGVLNFRGGGGKVTVSGLSAGVIKQGTTVTVKQGAKTIASVTGTLPDGNAAKKIAVGERITDTYATIYATYTASNTSGFAQASGNGIMVNEAGRYAVSLVAGSAYANGKSACTLTITRPGMSTVTQQQTLKVVNILWEGELPAGSVITGVSTISGGGNIHSIVMTVAK